MPMPPISPTGAMSSGDYVSYMFSYLPGAIKSVQSDLKAYVSAEIISDWSTMWNRTVNDINTEVTTLGSTINNLSAQVTMAKIAASNI